MTGDGFTYDIAVTPTSTWAEALPLRWAVQDSDGAYTLPFDGGGTAEIVLVGTEIAAEGEERAGRMIIGQDGTARQVRMCALPLKFATIDRGQRAGAILADALARVQAIHDEPPVGDHDHDPYQARFSRKSGPVEICRLCGETLREWTLEEWWEQQEAQV